jgi:hypothetical protein
VIEHVSKNVWMIEFSYDFWISRVGHHIVFETVAGRTSAIVPSLQRKNGGEFCRPISAPSACGASSHGEDTDAVALPVIKADKKRKRK